MNYKGISSRERKLLDELSRRGLLVFRPIDVSNILEEPKDNTYRILSRMVEKDIIERIEKGKYVTKRDMEETHIYEIACHIIEPSYLSLRSALHHYGYTTQVPRNVYVMTSISREDLDIHDETVRFVKTKHFFGYVSKGDLVIAEPEKLFIDCLLYPRYTGGMNEIAASMDEAELDEENLIDHALKVDNSSLNSRLGYLLEKSGKEIDLKPLEKNRSKSPVPLEPEREGEKIDKRWNVRF